MRTVILSEAEQKGFPWWRSGRVATGRICGGERTKDDIGGAANTDPIVGKEVSAAVEDGNGKRIREVSWIFNCLVGPVYVPVKEKKIRIMIRKERK